MSDELLTGLFPKLGLRVLLASTGRLVRKGRDLHECLPAAAALLGQALTAGTLMAALQKEDSRVNLQLECDGPLRGLFVDASSRGTVRGYVKNPQVEFHGTPGEFQWRPVLGNGGFLSVLRDRGAGEYYRSSIQLEAFDLARDLERYFDLSEQLRTGVFLDSAPISAEPLGVVAGMLLQPLPDGDRAALQAHCDRLRRPEGFRAVVHERASTEPVPLEAWVASMFPGEDFTAMSRVPVVYQCQCSRDRVLDALASIGKKDLEELIEKDGKAETTCEFCMTHYDISGAELRRLLTGDVQ